MLKFILLSIQAFPGYEFNKFGFKKYYIRQTAWEEPQVWQVSKGGASDRVVDDRAELFVALRNLAKAMCPNCEFRSESTIYDIEELVL